MTKEEVMDLIINDYKNGNQSAMGDYCYRTKCNDCPFDSDNCTNESHNTLIERLVKAEEQSKSLEKTCYKLQQALEEKAETNFDHYYDGKLAFDDFANTGDEKLIADIYTLCFKPGTDKVYKQSGIYDFKRWLLSPYEEPPKPKFKLTQFEYDLVDFCKQYNDTFVIEDWAVLMDMHDKGHFKGIPTDVPVKDILENCEVAEE